MAHAKTAVLSVLLGLSVLLSTCDAYGFITRSRSGLCTERNSYVNKNCGRAKEEPQYIEGNEGFPTAGPLDGKIASANFTEYKEMDEFGADRWVSVPISDFVLGEKDGKLVVEFMWFIAKEQRRKSFEYYISKKAFNPDAPLTRDQLELVPFCTEYERPGEFVMQGMYGSKGCELDAAGYSGKHVILGVWTLYDRPTAFYQVIDVNFPDTKLNAESH